MIECGGGSVVTMASSAACVMPEQRRWQMAAEILLGRLGTPEDVTLAVLFFAPDNSSWITGATLDVAGGWVMT